MTNERLKGDFVAGVIDAPENAEMALRDLAVEGFTEDQILVLTGAKGSEVLDKVDGAGRLGRLRRFREDYVGSAHELRERYKEEAERGHYLVIVRMPHPEKKDVVHRVLESHGAHGLVTRVRGSYISG
jgi:alkanesulfonate monooxygenase SsuD/methylene tetrahydromethanopterin reductase-like flavin-dependent oxidoreductase (luciferase family)